MYGMLPLFPSFMHWKCHSQTTPAKLLQLVLADDSHYLTQFSTMATQVSSQVAAMLSILWEVLCNLIAESTMHFFLSQWLGVCCYMVVTNML